ncbi:MAG: MarR family winged helix-turn-helix transcriptional regulator [Ilumatobacter sp.]|uniref:MarR family winged helix-turn-helix transcriptional regulator n=1 Tax=Ilumatobacter sp. TaxID=1967498 RepID=UPI00391BEA13
MQPPNLALSLLHAADWFNDALAERMAQRGFPLLNRSQALVMANLQFGPCRPSELARRLGMSRQAVQQLLRPLSGYDLVEVQPDPDDGRAVLVHPTLAAMSFGIAAAEELACIEAELRLRIGDSAVDQLHRVIALDWGAPPADR